MSVLVLKMNDVNCAIEVQGDDLSVALQVMNVVPEQLNNVGMWQFLRGYVGKTLLWDSAALSHCPSWLLYHPASGNIPLTGAPVVGVVRIEHNSCVRVQIWRLKDVSQVLTQSGSVVPSNH